MCTFWVRADATPVPPSHTPTVLPECPKRKLQGTANGQVVAAETARHGSNVKQSCVLLVPAIAAEYEISK